MNPKLDNLICTCGHTRKDHKPNSWNTLQSICQVKRKYDFHGGDAGWIDDCHEFVLDNIKYLEMQYEKQL